MIETINEALIACVKACGGSKVMGHRLWPEKPVDAAQRLLLDCLNEDRPQHLSPEQVQLVLRIARERGFHAGAEYLMEALSYARPQPVEPKDELAELLRQSIEQMKQLEANQRAHRERAAAAAEERRMTPVDSSPRWRQPRGCCPVCGGTDLRDVTTIRDVRRRLVCAVRACSASRQSFPEPAGGAALEADRQTLTSRARA